MNKLSAKQISNIEKAVNKATDIVFDEGLSPSAAIAKTASVMKLSSDYLPIIIHAFNNGAAEVHRKEASTIQEKAADYPIAIQSEVYRLLGAPLEKKASAPVVEDTFYNMPLSHTCPDAWSHLDKYKYRQATDWDDIKPFKIKSASDRSDHHRNAVNDIAIAVADEVTRIKYAAQDAYEKAYTDLETEMRKYGGVPLETAVMHAKAAHGNTGVSLVMTVIKNNNLEKNAGFRKDVFMTVDHPFAKKLKDLVFKNEQLKEAKAQEQRELKKCAEAMTALLPEKRKPIEGMDVFDTMFKEGTLNRKKKEYQRSVRARSEERQKRAYTPSSVNPLTGASGLDSLIHPSWGGLDPFERDLMYGLADPVHEGKLRQIRMQSILTDLMSTDPYLKEKDPEEVLDAVNEILELNKELHNNKPMLRVALRQYLESGGLDIPTLGIINDYGAKEKDRDAKERASRESAAIQQMSESTRLRDSQLTRELQKSQKLDDYLATAIQSGKARDTQKSIAKKDRAARDAEGKANRQNALELQDRRDAFTREENNANRENAINLQFLRDVTTRSEGRRNRRNAEKIQILRDGTAQAEGTRNRRSSIILQAFRDANARAEGDRNRQNAIDIQNMRNGTYTNPTTGTPRPNQPGGGSPFYNNPSLGGAAPPSGIPIPPGGPRSGGSGGAQILTNDTVLTRGATPIPGAPGINYDREKDIITIDSSGVVVDNKNNKVQIGNITIDGDS